MTETTGQLDYWATRPFSELKEEIVRRAGHKSPFVRVRPEDAQRAVDRLKSVGHEDWVAAWAPLGDENLDRARSLEAAGERAQARDAYLQAWTYYSVARYPCPSSAVKREAYRKGQAAYLAAAQYFDHHFERIALPFEGRPGEGSEVVVYLHRPLDVERPPVVVLSGGIDQFKEEAHATAVGYVRAGLAALAYDMPGTGEAPVLGSPDAERMYDPIFRYLAGREDVDGSRIAVVGRSFGGYWASKIAHTHRQWIRAAVNWGGSVHYAFQPDFIRRSRGAVSYLFELLETRAHAFGLRTAEEYIEAAPRFSLLTQGILEQESALQLLVNGKDDQQVPIDDLYILLEYGSPKLARVFPGGHLGPVPVVDALVRDWVVGMLKGTSARP